MYGDRCRGLVKETQMRLPGSSTPEPFPLSHHTLTTQPDRVPFSFTPGAPSGGLTTSHSTRQFIPHAGITGDGPSEEHPWAFIPTCSPVSIPFFCLHSLCPSTSPITTFHLLILKGGSHPQPSLFPSAACRLSHLEEKHSSPAFSCPAPLPPPSVS